MRNLDVNNKEKLDDYSNFSLKNVGNSISNVFQSGVQSIQNAGQNALSSTQGAIQKANEKAKEAVKKAEEAKNRANEKLKEAAKKALEAAKKAAEDTKKGAHNLGKSLTKNFKDLSDKAKSAFNKLLAKQSLAGLYLLIRSNHLGIATKLYPAVAPANDVINSKIKPTYISKSKSAYSEILSKWTSNGGKVDKLNEAILKGAKMRFGKSSFNGLENAGYIDGFFFTGIDGSNNDLNDISYYKAIKEYYSGCEGSKYSNAGGDELNESGSDFEASSISVIDEPTVAENNALIEETGSSNVDEEQKSNAIQKFIAFIMSVFKKNKMDDVPYVDGSDLANQYMQDEKSVSDELLKAKDDSIKYGDSGSNIGVDPNEIIGSGVGYDDKILGIPKIGFWIGASVLSVGAIGAIIYLIVRKK